MPNWCNNSIRINGDEKIISTLVRVIENTKDTEDRVFQSIIGSPVEIDCIFLLLVTSSFNELVKDLVIGVDVGDLISFNTGVSSSLIAARTSSLINFLRIGLIFDISLIDSVKTKELIVFKTSSLICLGTLVATSNE